MKEKNVKLTKQTRALSSCHNKIFNLLTENCNLKILNLKRFYFRSTLVSVLEKIESDKTKHKNFINTQKQKQLLMKVGMKRFLFPS